VTWSVKVASLAYLTMLIPVFLQAGKALSIEWLVENAQQVFEKAR
jgi:hypothetical protein